MAVIASPPSDEEALARFVSFIGLDGVAEVRAGEVSFPPGILWPYTNDLRRVRAAFDHAEGASTDALLTAMATLHARIAFAPGPAAGAVADAYRDATRSGS